MANSTNQRKLLTKNKYQDELIKTLFSPFLFIVGGLWLVPIVLILTEEPALKILKSISLNELTAFYHWSAFLVVALAVIFVLALIWVYVASNRWVGAFERIIREMDGVIAGKSKNHISARKNDVLALDLLKRVNALIDGYQKLDK